MSILNKFLKLFLGDKNQKDLKELKPYIDKINSVANSSINNLSNDELRQKTQIFKQKLIQETQDFIQSIEKIKQEIENTQDILAKEKLYNDIEEIQKKSYKKEEEVLLQILPEAFALIRETAKRFAENTEIKVTATELDIKFAQDKSYVSIQGEHSIWKNNWNAFGKEVIWDMIHYDVQFIGGTVLHTGRIAEMATGEGKTLVATLPVYLNALPARGVHVVTVNDYLAKRDSAWMAPIFEFHGLTIDCIDNHQPNSNQRRQAYQADITYGTNNEFGFDYLRDNMATSSDELVQRPLNFAIVDEVDSVLIDDARTPLIIAGPVPNGDKQEYDILKPKVEKIVSIQKQELSKIFVDAKNLIQSGDKKEGGFKLYQVYRGMPKYKPLIKFLSEDGIKALLQKNEGIFISDNNREMPKVTKDLYFVIEEKNNSIELTDKGIDFLSQDSEDKNLFVLPDLGSEIADLEKENLNAEEEFNKKEEIYRDFSIKSERIHSLNQLLKAYTVFEKDVEYVVMDGQVKIVDEQTGRIMEGRRYSDGLHQALEAKENVKIEAATQTFATVTLQNYFRMYNKLCGMTGTAETEAGEFWQIYKLDVVVIPTNRPIQRKDKHDLVYKTNREKYNAVIEEIVNITQNEKRPVLVGTTSVEISELLGRALQMRKIPHNVLNAKLHKKEADIVAEAGRAGIVTIATNMAGRGTDIKLIEEVKKAGGLAIIGTERHDSRRVDRQLRGRSGRQGDPGSSQFYVSLEDNLMRLFGSDRIAKMMDRMGHKEGEVIQHSMISRSIERAQKKVEENNFGIRKRLLEYDDVMNKQREVIYKRRRNALSGQRLNLDIANMIFDVAESITVTNKNLSNYKNFKYELIKYFTMETTISEDDFKRMNPQEIVNNIYNQAQENYNKKTDYTTKSVFPVIENVFNLQGNMFKNVVIPFSDGIKELSVIADLHKSHETQGKSLITEFEKNITLSLIDENWKEHLREMDELRKSVQTASYEQKDPLVIYKQESFNLFSQMIDNINKQVVSFLFKGEFAQANNNQNQVKQAPTQKKEITQEIRSFDQDNSENQENNQEKITPRSVNKINRNDVVNIINIQTGERKSMKFKQAETLILGGLWILENEI